MPQTRVFASFASIHALRCRSIHARTALSSVELLAERPVAPAAANLSWPFRQRQPALRRPVVSDYTTAWLDSFGSECGRGSSLTEFKRFCRSAFCGLRPSVGFVPSAEGPNVTVQSRGRGSCTLNACFLNSHNCDSSGHRSVGPVARQSCYCPWWVTQKTTTSTTTILLPVRLRRRLLLLLLLSVFAGQVVSCAGGNCDLATAYIPANAWLENLAHMNRAHWVGILLSKATPPHMLDLK